MSQSKIKKMRLPKILNEAAKGPTIGDTEPPADLLNSVNDTLLKATIDGQECVLPFEVLEQTLTVEPDEVPHLDETCISRLPFKCPAGGCGQPCSLVTFAMHMTFDHGKDVLVESLWPSETNTVLIDPHVPAEVQLPRCHTLYLVSGKVRGLGDGKYRDKLPFALMSSKFSVHGQERLVLWITGPEAGVDQRHRYTMEAGRNDQRRLLPYAIAFSGEIVPLHSSQVGAEIHRSGAGLVIPEQQIDFLTSSRRTKLLEVCVHFH